jgi:hypothetical protein
VKEPFPVRPFNFSCNVQETYIFIAKFLNPPL